ncbi:hypothetical protein D3C87_1292840 [compost metagenome]
MRLVSLFLVAVGATIAGIYYSKNRSDSLIPKQDETKNKTKPIRKITSEQMDDRLDDSFPASDPPSWGPRDLLH